MGRSFTFRFDPFLSEPSCASAVFQLVHDECLTVRRSALRVFARLASHHKGIFLHGLNQTIVELLTSLEYELDWKTKGATATWLSELRIDTLNRIVMIKSFQSIWDI